MAVAAWKVFPRPTSSAMRAPQHLPGDGFSVKSMRIRACTPASWCQWRAILSIWGFWVRPAGSNSSGLSQAVSPPWCRWELKVRGKPFRNPRLLASASGAREDSTPMPGSVSSGVSAKVMPKAGCWSFREMDSGQLKKSVYRAMTSATSSSDANDLNASWFTRQIAMKQTRSSACCRLGQVSKQPAYSFCSWMQETV
jgi:hypothetical protein